MSLRPPPVIVDFGPDAPAGTSALRFTAEQPEWTLDGLRDVAFGRLVGATETLVALIDSGALTTPNEQATWNAITLPVREALAFATNPVLLASTPEEAS